MTNPLTWNFKLIRLPRIKPNLLAVISMVILCAAVFVTMNTIASACDSSDLEAAREALQNAWDAVSSAAQALEDARETGNEDLIEQAEALAAAAVKHWLKCLFDYGVAWLEYQYCLGSGGCDSGGCS